jgi:hypothetical protein
MAITQIAFPSEDNMDSYNCRICGKRVYINEDIIQFHYVTGTKKPTVCMDSGRRYSEVLEEVKRIEKTWVDLEERQNYE